MPGFEPELLEAFKRKLILIIFANSVYVGWPIYLPPPPQFAYVQYTTQYTVYIYIQCSIYTVCIFNEMQGSIEDRKKCR